MPRKVLAKPFQKKEFTVYDKLIVNGSFWKHVIEFMLLRSLRNPTADIFKHLEDTKKTLKKF